MKVQDHDGKGIKTGRLWVQIGDHNHHYTVYDYTPDHSGDGPRRVFKGFEGYLQADAYSVYDALFEDGTIIEVGCWMHARRKFFEAKTSDPRGRTWCWRGSPASTRSRRTRSGTKEAPRVGRRGMARAPI